MPESQTSWYASQMFIGNNMCAVIAKHWLVDKACNMPARDAIRQGYDIDCDNDDDRAISKKLRKRDKKYRITHQLEELVHFGRVYSGRKYHKSHFIKFVPLPVPNILKPMYNYFGVFIPERIYE
ncbi:anti-CBASS protein Acb1 family protein [Proteus mirabilis]|uniref:anti-CBASS protein Acb1 family protein n=1 Tax=Proteus mirabilis TaxID=584 RepID=UPI00385BC82A